MLCYLTTLPRLRADGVELFHESLGEGTPLILQSHDHTPWLFFQAPVFSQTYRFVTFDRGSSPSTAAERAARQARPATGASPTLPATCTDWLVRLGG